MKTQIATPSIATLIWAVLAVAFLSTFPFSPIQAQDQTLGLFLNDTAAYNGYTLFAPLHSSTTYLIDMYGRQVHSWEATYPPGGGVYLLENGELLRPARPVDGGGGLIQKIDWDGTLLWEFEYFDSTVRQHHDVEALPNGNVLVLAWEFKTKAEAIAAGRDSLLFESEIVEVWPEHVIEVEPIYPTGGNTVWEWHLWDHLIQDFDSSKNNFGEVAEHPELIDINFAISEGHDWLHANAVDYNPALDQIIISCRQISQFFVIDHSTTSLEAAGHTGGDRGMGGDLLYRWGNAAGHDAGTEEDQKLFLQHDAQWIEPGLPGEGNILLFNNGGKNRNYSTADEIETTVDSAGNYPQPGPGAAHGPDQVSWAYGADPDEEFYASFLSGASRLANGNTLICAGPQGWFFEVTSEGEKVWEYINPVGVDGPGAQGDTVGTNRVFRCYRYSPNYPGLQGRDLTPGGPLELYPTTISGTYHLPQNPTSDDSIVITASVVADSGIQIAELHYSTGSGFSEVALYDDGNHHDSLPNDGLFAATIPPLPAGTNCAYYISCTDSLGAVTTDPPNPPATAYSFVVESEGEAPVCGDVDGDGQDVNISDLVFLVDWMFTGGAEPPVIQTADVDGSGGWPDIADLVYIVDYMFNDGPAPVCI